MISREATTPDREETIAQARAIRVEHATTAALYRNRVEPARARAPHRGVHRWTDEHRRSAPSCRQLGEIIRREREAA